MNIRTGEYTRHTTDEITKRAYFTFKPRPLLDGDFYTLDEELTSKLTEAHRALGVLCGVVSSLPNQEHFINLMRLKEGCCSHMIDYAEPNLLDITVAYGLDTIDERIQNIISAYSHNVKKGFSRFILSDVTAHALHGKNTKKQLYSRTEHTFLSRSNASFQQYNPTAPEHISGALSDIVGYLCESKADPMIKAALCHYQFEIVHPYECYNGITGRVLTYLILRNAGLNEVDHLAISNCLFEHKEEYFQKLGQTQREGRYLDWLFFFVQMIIESAQGSLNAAEKYRGIVSNTDSEIVKYFQQRIVTNVANTAKHLEISYSTANRLIEQLLQVGILTQITYGSRNRLFAHTDMMKLILGK